MADAKYAMEDGSYPINTCADVSDAAKLAHNSKTYSFEQVKAHVMKAADALGCGEDVFPETWDTAPRSVALEEGGDFVRAMPFEVVPSGDGQTLEGYAAPFNSWARIKDWAGEYDEAFSPGAFKRSLSERTPALLFEHGKHPLIGSMPLGVFQELRSDAKGLYVRARLSGNWLVQPVRDAVRDGAITGMSVRFQVPKGGEKVTQQSGRVRRMVNDATLIELGPTLTPAYQATTASIRSILDRLPDLTGRSDAGSADGGDSSDAAPGNGGPSPEELAARQRRHNALRIRGII